MITLTDEEFAHLVDASDSLQAAAGHLLRQGDFYATLAEAYLATAVNAQAVIDNVVSKQRITEQTGVTMSTDALLRSLGDITQAVRVGDSFEGGVTYTCMNPDLGRDEWRVAGVYRVGNLDGQGGLRLIRGDDP